MSLNYEPTSEPLGDLVEGSTVRMRAFNLVGKKDAYRDQPEIAQYP